MLEWIEWKWYFFLLLLWAYCYSGTLVRTTVHSATVHSATVHSATVHWATTHWATVHWATTHWATVHSATAQWALSVPYVGNSLHTIVIKSTNRTLTNITLTLVAQTSRGEQQALSLSVTLSETNIQMNTLLLTWARDAAMCPWFFTVCCLLIGRARGESVSCLDTGCRLQHCLQTQCSYINLWPVCHQTQQSLVTWSSCICPQ